MARVLKELIVDELKNEFAGVDTAVLVSFEGIDNENNLKLRVDLREKGVRLRLVSNRLARLSLQGTHLAPLFDGLVGSTAVVYGAEGTDPVSVPKAICPWEKKAKGLNLKIGVMDGRIIGPEEIQRISTLPSRDELLAQIAGALVSPLASIASALVSPLQDIVGLLESLHKKKEEEGGQ
jgi:large subunit ribosomal protein L10